MFPQTQLSKDVPFFFTSEWKELMKNFEWHVVYYWFSFDIEGDWFYLAIVSFVVIDWLKNILYCCISYSCDRHRINLRTYTPQFKSQILKGTSFFLKSPLKETTKIYKIYIQLSVNYCTNVLRKTMIRAFKTTYIRPFFTPDRRCEICNLHFSMWHFSVTIYANHYNNVLIIVRVMIVLVFTKFQLATVTT